MMLWCTSYTEKVYGSTALSGCSFWRYRWMLADKIFRRGSNRCPAQIMVVRVPKQGDVASGAVVAVSTLVILEDDKAHEISSGCKY